MKPGLKYGLINAAIGMTWVLLMFVTGLNRSDSANIINILAIAIPVICCIQAVNEVRATEGGGWISFGRAFKESFLVTVIGSIFSSLFYVIYIKFIDPTFMDFMMNKQVSKMQEMGMSEDQILKAMNQSAAMQTPGWLMVWGIVIGMFLGAVISLIVAGVMKKQNPEEIA